MNRGLVPHPPTHTPNVQYYELWWCKCLSGPVTNVLIVTPQRVNLPPLQPLRKVRSANGEAERQAVLFHRPENDVPIPGNKTFIFMERYLDELQVGWFCVVYLSFIWCHASYKFHFHISLCCILCLFYVVQKHGGSSRLFDFGPNAQNGTPNQQGTEWRDRYLELQDLFVHEVLHQMPSSRNPWCTCFGYRRLLLSIVLIILVSIDYSSIVKLSAEAYCTSMHAVFLFQPWRLTFFLTRAGSFVVSKQWWLPFGLQTM
jgi:hypothetical protein